tara:strand:- start:42020 stop:42868 length:849 start_codon:yes stop_codon:yes gene_type:complete
MKDYIIYNGSLIPEEELRISPLNRGMMYGDGCFDTLRSYQGKFLKLEEHYSRFIAGANFLGIEAPFYFNDFKFKILELLEASNMLETDALVRVQCWRDGKRGYATDSSMAHWITSCAPITSVKETIMLSTVYTRAIPSRALERQFKLSNGLNYIQAAREATTSGADDALMLTMAEKISETTISNIFWVKGNTTFTPSLNCDLLPGITRDIVIELTRKMEGINLIEGEYHLEEILQAEAVFTTNSIREIRLVESIDNNQFDVKHSSIAGIKEQFEDFKQANLK